MADPVVTLINPQAGSELAKQSDITFLAFDTDGDIVAITAIVNGLVAYRLTGGFFASGWYASTVERVDDISGKGWLVSLIPDRFATWRNSEAVRLQVSAIDDTAASTIATWEFVAAPRKTPPIVNYLVSSIRNEDNKG